MDQAAVTVQFAVRGRFTAAIGAIDRRLVAIKVPSQREWMFSITVSASMQSMCRCFVMSAATAQLHVFWAVLGPAGSSLGAVCSCELLQNILTRQDGTSSIPKTLCWFPQQQFASRELRRSLTVSCWSPSPGCDLLRQTSPSNSSPLTIIIIINQSSGCLPESLKVQSDPFKKRKTTRVRDATAAGSPSVDLSGHS